MSVFYDLYLKRGLFSTEHFMVLRDGFPVSPGHTLIVSKRPAETFFDLTDDEKQELVLAIGKAKENIEGEFKPDGYNIGMNCGEAAGQTVHHFHLHLIPRYTGDCENPRGGVRHCVPGKGNYDAGN